MKTAEERANELLGEYEKATGMVHTIKAEILTRLLIRAMKEQDKITREACIKSVIETKGEDSDLYLIHRSDVYDAIENTKAL